MELSLGFRHVARTDVGRVRSHNEDRVYASPRIVAVADGVGGRAAGEVASFAAIDEVIALDKRRLSAPLEEALARAVESGNERIGFVASCRPRMTGMSTTLTAVGLDGERYSIANIGDSRAYLLRGGRLTRLTRDDSYVQELIDAGALTEDAAREHPQRSVVLAALDGEPGRRPRISAERARLGDRLLLCSDGISDLVDDPEIHAALSIPSAQQAAETLIEHALTAGGSDNASAVIADVVALADPSEGWQR
jgi:serine/threonine protein phosphatase PrpC